MRIAAELGYVKKEIAILEGSFVDPVESIKVGLFAISCFLFFFTFETRLRFIKCRYINNEVAHDRFRLVAPSTTSNISEAA